mgnify:CR=1 FL=1
MRYIEAKTILSKLKSRDSFFGLSYNMNLYRGCQHACIYCDTRSDCYGIGDISQISVKTNAIELLTRELSNKKRIKGTIGTGSMNDPYMPVESKVGITRKAMEVIARSGYPVHVITKGKYVTRDYDLLQEISKSYAAVSFTITTADDGIARKLEPGASSTSERFAAMEFLANKGIYTGITLMPLLPFINDNTENIRSIVKCAKDVGASYIIPMFGLTMRKGSRDYLYEALDKDFPQLRAKYEKIYGEQYICNSPDWKQLSEVFNGEISGSGISDRMKFYEPKVNQQLSLF